MKGFWIKPLIFLFSLTCFFKVNAQVQHSHNFSLYDLVQHAVKYSPVLKSKQASINASMADKQSVKDEFIPTAVVGDEVIVGTDNSLPGAYLSRGIIPSASAGIHPSNNWQPATGNFAVLSSEYEIASFGYKNARLKNAQAAINVSEDDKRREIYLMKWRLSKLYFTLRKQQLQVAIEAQNVNRYEELFKIIRGITISGLKAGADSSQALAELSRTKIDYNNAVKETQLVKQEIAYLTGISVDSIEADTTETAHQIAVMKIMGNLSDTAKNPLLDYFKTKQLLYQSNADVISKSYRPHLMLNGAVWARGSSVDYNSNYKSLADGLGYQRYNYLAGISLFYNLTGLVQKRDKLASNRQKIMAAQFDAQHQQQTLDNVNKQADRILDMAAADLKEIPVQLRAATDALNQKTAQYKAGIINLVDLTNANYVLYRAQTDYAQALNDWFLANVDKSAATGTLDLFIQSLN